MVKISFKLSVIQCNDMSVIHTINGILPSVGTGRITPKMNLEREVGHTILTKASSQRLEVDLPL